MYEKDEHLIIDVNVKLDSGCCNKQKLKLEL